MKLRLAPTQAAPLHVGHARLALVNYLVARRHGADLLLRLDDADPEHSRPGLAEAAQHDLRWLGLDWDALAHQSARRARYAEAAERLKAAGRLYPCFEGDDELTFKRELRQRQGKSPIYDRAMLRLTPAQRAKAEAGGKQPYWRFLLSGAAAAWGDMILGRQEVKLSALSDPVLIRADGTPLHTFTAAVDDLQDGMTHVVRDAEDLINTGLQLDLRAALGARPNTIRFGHLPAPEPPHEAPARPGKRPALPSLRSLRNDGIEPAALCGTLAGLGTPGPATPEPSPAHQLAPHWDLTRIARDTPRFDPAQLLAANRAALRAMPFEAARGRLPPGATAAFWSAVCGSLDMMREARFWWDVAAGTIAPPPPAADDGLIRHALATLPPEPWTRDTWHGWTSALAGSSCPDPTPPLRLALTGEDGGPDLAELLPLMGRNRVEQRLHAALG